MVILHKTEPHVCRQRFVYFLHFFVYMHMLAQITKQILTTSFLDLIVFGKHTGGKYFVGSGFSVRYVLLLLTNGSKQHQKIHSNEHRLHVLGRDFNMAILTISSDVYINWTIFIVLLIFAIEWVLVCPHRRRAMDNIHIVIYNFHTIFKNIYS